MQKGVTMATMVEVQLHWTDWRCLVWSLRNFYELQSLVRSFQWPKEDQGPPALVWSWRVAFMVSRDASVRHRAFVPVSDQLVRPGSCTRGHRQLQYNKPEAKQLRDIRIKESALSISNICSRSQSKYMIIFPELLLICIIWFLSVIDKSRNACTIECGRQV